jgi:hypothetical protein
MAAAAPCAFHPKGADEVARLNHGHVELAPRVPVLAMAMQNAPRLSIDLGGRLIEQFLKLWIGVDNTFPVFTFLKRRLQPEPYREIA